MNEKKYLKWYNKLGYGSGDWASNMIYAIMNSFVMIYLTDSVGLNAAVVGTLIMFSKIADGFTDVIFGSFIDKTHSKMGKARPWMLWSFIGNAVVLVAMFSTPMALSETMKYVYFFVTYTLLNAIFYTINNIAYASLTALITKNSNERVQLGSFRYMFALATNLTVSYITVDLVGKFGGGAAGWRTVAMIYAAIGLVINTLSVFSVKELPEEELLDDSVKKDEKSVQKVSLLTALKILVTNKYYLLILSVYLFKYIQAGLGAVGIYYATYIFGEPSMLGTFSSAQMLPMIISLIFSPIIIKKVGSIRTMVFWGYVIAVLSRFVFIWGGMNLNLSVMVVSLVINGIVTAPLTGSLNALIAETADYTYRTKGVRIDGTMFSCSSVGIKVGTGIGTALVGVLLNAGGYIANAAVQPDSCIAMLNFSYLWAPTILTALIALAIFFLDVEKANRVLVSKSENI